MKAILEICGVQNVVYMDYVALSECYVVVHHLLPNPVKPNLFVMLQISLDNYSNEENTIPSILVKAKKKRRFEDVLAEFTYCMPKKSYDSAQQIIFSILNDDLPVISELIARKLLKASRV